MDAAVLTALDIPPPPWRPQIVEERQEQPRQTSEYERLATRYAEAYDRYADEWIAKLGASRAALEVAATRQPSLDLIPLERAIEEAESQAERGARQRARFAKRLARDIKRDFKTDPALGAATRMLGDRLLRTDDRILEALLDYALFLRAFRAEHDPEARGGPVFDNASDLGRYLRAQAA